MNRFDSTLSLCMRAKRLSYGFDTVKGLVLKGQVFLLLTASDLSPKTVKEVRYLSERYNVPCLPHPAAMEGIQRIIGRKTGVIGITDQGLAAKLMSTHNEMEESTI